MYNPYPGSTQMPETSPVPVKIWAIVVWLVGLAAIVLLWRRSSTAFFQAVPA